MAKTIPSSGKIVILIILALGAIGLFAFVFRAHVSSQPAVVSESRADPNTVVASHQAIGAGVRAQARMERIRQYRLEAEGQTDPRGSVEALRKLAMAHLEAGQKAEAIAVCSKLLDIKVVRTRVASCAIDVANAAYNCGDYVTARAIYELVVEKGQSENALFAAKEGLTKITIFSDTGTMGSEAAEALWVEFKGHVKAPEAMLRIAQALEKSGNTDKAVELYGRIAENWPTSGSGLKAAEAMASTSSGAISEGLKTSAAPIHPTATVEQRAMALALTIQAEATEKLAEGQTENAKTLAAKAATAWAAYEQHSPPEHRAEMHYNRGQCLMLAGKPEEAIACYEAYVDEFPLNQGASSAQFMVGECYRMMKERGTIDKVTGEDLMKKAYMRVLKNYPGGPMAKGAAARLGSESISLEGDVK